MWRISLLDSSAKPYIVPSDRVQLQPKYTVITAPIRFSEVFNFDGLLNDKEARDTLTILNGFIDRWKTVMPYHSDPFAPTIGNVKVIIERMLIFAHHYPNGLWYIEKAGE